MLQSRFGNPRKWLYRTNSVSLGSCTVVTVIGILSEHLYARDPLQNYAKPFP